MSLPTFNKNSNNGKANIKQQSKEQNTDIYKPIAENWYKALPYAFKTNNEIIYLPISPQNISISTHFATNTITTLYSTVEEHSEVRYFDITIQGTTGFSPKYIGSKKIGEDSNPLSGRISYGAGAIVDSGVLYGWGAGTINKINASVNKASDALRFGLNKSHESGVFTDRTGYIAFHKLYLFLLKYKKDTASGKFKKNTQQPSPLMFLNYKDNNQYSCSIQRFSLDRGVDNPMLYNYSIQLRAYNLNALALKKIDQDLDSKLTTLGLDNQKASILARARNTISSARASINSAVSAVSGAGR